MTTTNDIEIIGALAIFLLQKTGSIFGRFKGHLTAAEQRAAFGCVPFGKMEVKIDGEKETVAVIRSVCFGQDWEENTRSWADMEQDCRANQHPFRLGRFGGKYDSLPR